MFWLVQLIRIDNAALEHIQRAMRGPFVMGACDIVKKINDNQAAIFGAFSGEGRFGTVVLSYSSFDRGQVMNIECAGSDRGDIDTVQAVLPGLLDYARSKGCVAVAMETARPGLIEKSKKLGFEPVSTRCEVRL